jgi:hypothetical protein
MALPTKSVSALEIFQTGTWNGDVYTERDLDDMVRAFGKVGFQPTIKAGHENGQENKAVARRAFGEPALGSISRIWRSGQKLLADVTGIPKRFGDLIEAGSYKRVSAEIYWNYKSGEKVYPRVLKALSFLGGDIPALTSLTAIESLFQRTAGGAVRGYSAGREFRVYSVERHDYHDGMGLADYLATVPRMPKLSVDYRQREGDEACGNCKFFLPGLSACGVVEGHIEPYAVSDLFEALPEMETVELPEGETEYNEADDALARKLHARYSTRALDSDEDDEDDEANAFADAIDAIDDEKDEDDEFDDEEC